MSFLSRLFGGSKTAPAQPEAPPADQSPAEEGRGLQPKVEELIAELITIGSTVGFTSTTQRHGNFDIKGDNVRVREIGSLIHRIGKTELMKEASARVMAKLGPQKTKQLSYVWLGIGDWKI